MTDNVVELDTPISARTAKELLTSYARKDRSSKIKDVIIVYLDEDNCPDFAFSEMSAGDLTYLTMFLQASVARGLITEDED